MDHPFFVRNGSHFSVTLVAPWFLNKTYKLDPLWIQFFVLYKIDDWAQIDSGTPSALKLVFCGPRSREKMVPKFQLSNLQKMEREISTLVVWKVPRHDFFGSIMVWHIVRARPKLTLAHLALRCALETAKMVIKCYFLRVKKSPKNSKKSRTNFFGFFWFSMAQTLKNNVLCS